MPSNRPFLLLVLLSALAGKSAPAAEVEPPPKDNEPVLRIDPGAPAAFVTALVFSPDGKTLYAAGWDKIIRVWTLNDKGRFEPGRSTFRVPVGPGLSGALNALALSPDGKWLAAGGYGASRQIAGFRELGFMVPAFGVRDPVMLRDVGAIYLFNTRDGTVRTLRGHQGSVRSLTFGPPRKKGTSWLLSVAEEEKRGGAAETRLAARLWDTDKAESVAELKDLPAKELAGSRPGATLVPSGAEGDQVKAALALHDGKLHIWEPHNNKASPLRFKDLPYNLSVVALPGRGRLLTAGYSLEHKNARLTRWDFPSQGEPEADSRSVGGGLIRDLSLISSKADGTPDLAAVVVIQGRSPIQYRLRLIDLGRERFGRFTEKALWEQSDLLQPTVAASLRGAHVAVAGKQGHEIQVYRIASLLRKEDVSPQILQGHTLTFQHASFVRRGKDRGLLLNAKPRKQPGGAAPEPDGERGDWVFDFSKRRLTDKVNGWQAERPKAGGWSAKPDGARTIAVHNGDERIRAIAISGNEVLIDYALYPPGGVVPVPLLAVATHRGGQPYLRLYNAKSGEQLRECTGHKERLRSLAFAADGRLLVSSAMDGTVCVWSLTDLPTILEKHGRLPGVILGQAKETALVQAVESDSPAQGKLLRDDVLAGVVEKGALRRLQSPRDFYEAFYLLTPGTKVVLRRGDPQGKDDVALVVGQGIDERKPLFSLFVSQAAKADDSEWIGWSPLGPYESSSPKADRYLGWHFNTGETGAPTRFAGADKYREIYYREGVLGRLLERGDSRPEAIRLPPPDMGMWIEEAGQVLPDAGQAPIRVRRPQIDLKVQLRERLPSSLTALTWQLDGGKETPLALEDRNGNTFTIPMTLARGEHRLVVTARTPEAPLQPIREARRVHYRPSRPEIALKDADKQISVRQAAYTVKASIKPKAAGEDVRVTLLHRHDEGEEKPLIRKFAAREFAEGAALAFEQSLKLHPGRNVVEVVAVHGALDDKEETGRQFLRIHYIFKAKPPEIRFGQLTLLSEPGNGVALPVDDSRPMTVGAARVTLDGVIKAGEEPLIEAEWDRGKDTAATRLGKFEPGKRGEIAFAERIDLRPGVQTIRFRARTKTSDEAERGLTLEYQPPIPLVRLTDPPSGTLLDGQDETKTVRVHGVLALPSKEARGYKVVFLVNGQPAPEMPIIDEKAGVLDGVVRVGPGESRIQVRISNPWGTVGYSNEVSLHYVRPPIVQTLEHQPVPGRALVNLTAEVLSPSVLEDKLVRVTVNGRASTVNEVGIERGKQNLWTVRLRGLPLDAGSREQKLAVYVSNVEAECRRPGVLTIQSKKVLPAPEVDFLEPRQNMAVSTPFVTIRFQVRSEGELERVSFQQQGRPDKPIKLAGVHREGSKSELTATREVELRPGPNVLSVDAVSVSGRRPDSPHLVLTYVPPPLRVEIEHLTEGSDEGPPLLPADRDRRGFVFPRASSGQVWLHGHIHWADKGRAWQDDYFLLRVFVNGFQQFPVFVQRKAGDTEKTTFATPLLLSRVKGNHVSLVATRQDPAGNAECTVDCRAPITQQRMHVLALSAHSRADELKKRLEKAITARRAEKPESARTLEKVDIQTLTGSRASLHFLNTELAKLDRKMHGQQRTAANRGKPSNDVLILYYEGAETINEDGHFFETLADSGKGNALGMRCDKLVHSLSQVPGAQVLLLDVDRPARTAEDLSRDQIKSWERSYPDALAHIVVMRCAHRGVAGNPGVVRLLPVLQRTIPRADRLSRLVALVEEVIAASDDAALLIFKSYVPTELADLIVGSPP